MYRIAMIEDEASAAAQLQSAIEKYGEQNGLRFHVTWFQEGLTFLTSERPKYDIIFLDIQLPGMDGMEIARQIRAEDRFVCLCFVTNMQQYAINGYEVEARDFVLKPVKEFDFNIRFRKMLAYCNRNRQEFLLSIQSKNGNHMLNARDIFYIEVVGHHLIYHTKEGELSVRGTLAEAEDRLAASGWFGRCHSSYLVNFNYITSFTRSFVNVPGAEIPVSRTKREVFTKALNQYVATL